MWKKVSCYIVTVILILNMLTASHVAAANDKTKDNLTDTLTIGGGLLSVATALGLWGFGIFLEASALIHAGGFKIANNISASNYKSDSNYTAVVVPSSLELLRAQTDVPSFSEELNHMGNEAVNATLETSSLTLALATATNRYYTALATGDMDAVSLQQDSITQLRVQLDQVEDEAASKVEAFAYVVEQSGNDPTITKDQFTNFQNDVSSEGLPLEEIDLVNSLTTNIDPILLSEFDMISFFEDKLTLVTFPYFERRVSDGIRDIAEGVRYTSHVIGPFPTPVPTGANTYWLIITAVSLMLAGGYLIFRQKRKIALN